MRIGGLASGIDIDQMVSELMRVERLKVNQLEQKRQVLEWQQEYYRNINASLRSFRDNHVFNLRLQSTYMAKAASSGNQTVVTATAGPNAIEGQYSIEVKELAKGASIIGDKIGSSINKSTLENQIGLKGKDEEGKPVLHELNINGVVFKVDTATESIYELVSRINQHTTAGVSVNTIQKAVNPNEDGEGGVAQVQTLQLSDDALVDGLTLNVGGKKIVLYDSRMYENNENIAKLKYKDAELIKINAGDNPDDVLRSVDAVMQELAATMEGAVDSATIEYKDGEIIITSNEPGLANAVSVKVTGGKSWHVRASYDETLDRLFISTNKTGKDQKIEIKHTELSDKLMITKGADIKTADDEGNPIEAPEGITITAGQNARVIINDFAVEYSSNQFTLNGITYNLHNTSDSKVTISVKQDTDAILDTVVKFVEQYNKLIEDLEKKLYEEKFKGYTWPLTDIQREQLTDKQIEQWEEKARSGILRNDSTLRDIRDKLRFAVTALAEIGIKTTANYMTAKLEVDEDKLRQAIADNPQRVLELFAAEGDSNTAKGVARRLHEDLSYAITHIIDKAGASGSAKDDQSFIGKRLGNINDDIDRWEARLKQIEDRYWRQFTAMEKAISQMNQQSMWLAQQFFNSSM